MSIEPEGWYMDAGPPSWDAEAKTFSFSYVSRVENPCCAFSPLMRWRRLIPLSQVDQYLGPAGRIRNGTGFDFFGRS